MRSGERVVLMPSRYHNWDHRETDAKCQKVQRQQQGLAHFSWAKTRGGALPAGRASYDVSKSMVGDGRGRIEQIGGGVMEDEWFVCYEMRRNRRCEGGCYSCSLGAGELHCPSIESVTNTGAVPISSSFEKTDPCMSHCNSQSCILAQEEEQYLQNRDSP